MEDQLPLSVDVDLPRDVEALIKAHTAPEQGEVWTTVIHGALWEMRTRRIGLEAARAELEAELVEACASLDGGGIEVTPEWWEKLRARCEEDHRRIEQARAEGLVGNLLLPDELHRFVTDEVAAGRYASASDVVSAAVRVCTWYWQPPR